MTRQDILDSLSLKELTNTVAEHLMGFLKDEADDIGAELSDYDVSSLEDRLDSFSRCVELRLEEMFKELK